LKLEPTKAVQSLQSPVMTQTTQSSPRSTMNLHLDFDTISSVVSDFLKKRRLPLSCVSVTKRVGGSATTFRFECDGPVPPSSWSAAKPSTMDKSSTTSSGSQPAVDRRSKTKANSTQGEKKTSKSTKSKPSQTSGRSWAALTADQQRKLSNELVRRWEEGGK
jgi:hypothetical protein